MFRAIATACLLAFAAPAAMAFDIEAMTESERDAFRAEIRTYLLENPDVLMEAIAVLEDRREAEAQAREGELLVTYRNEIFEDGHSWVGGNPDGDVTIVEFLDYRCGYCKRAHPEVQTLLSGDGEIKMIVKEFPILGPESEVAARFAIATKTLEGDDAYAAVHDELMEWTGPINEGALGRIGRNAGVADIAAVRAEMNSDETTGIIAANRALGQALQIQGTPSFIMGDAFVRGYVDLQQMRSIIEGIRAQQG